MAGKCQATLAETSLSVFLCERDPGAATKFLLRLQRKCCLRRSQTVRALHGEWIPHEQNQKKHIGRRIAEERF